MGSAASGLSESVGSKAESGWSSLPGDLLRDIVGRLGSIVDVLAFRAVCPSWRQVGKPNPDVLASAHPLLAVELSPNSEVVLFDVAHRRFLRGRLPIRDPQIYTIPCSHGFVVASTAPNTVGSPVAILNILTGEQTELPLTPKPIEMFHRAILSGFPSSPGCTAILLGESSFLWCRVGDSSWAEHFLDGIHILDMIFLGEQLYASFLCMDALLKSEVVQLAAIDLHPSVQLRHYHNSLGKLWHQIWYRLFRCILADLRGKLLLLWYREFGGLTVLQFDFDFDSQRKPDRIFTLEGAALFLSSSSFVGAVVEPDCSLLRSDCIYWIGYYPHAWPETSLLSGYRQSMNCFDIEDAPPRGGECHRSTSWVLPQACLPAN